ncbi:arginine--tRNA ligase [Algicola sagamiensis]|uniref:arginine--tRNA ligase n=1 Tax=Algicola sagamiensis TaxID=163869 RepID=UPI000360D4DB|nr:arginine--tRNA ligase [Algicola sagamiensis]
MNIRELLTQKAQAAMIAAGLPEDTNPALTPSKRAGFGDYQINGAMGAAKKLKTNPRELAQKLVDNLELDGIASEIEIAGPGFINIHLNQDWLADALSTAREDARLGVSVRKNPQTVVVDYSAPNLAKEMHVGHLRSSIIGDAVVRALEFRGDKVIRQNHIGDWGTQFGMLLAHLSDQLAANEIAETALSDLEEFYRAAKKRFDDEEGFADRARDYVVKLQGGDEQCLALWQRFIDISLKHCEEVYEKLNVTLKREDVMGESGYNDDLANVVRELQEQGLAVEDQGAQVVFLEEMKNKEGEPMAVIIQKSGGGYLYSTTDLAAMRYRSFKLDADRIIIFTDNRQSLHFNQIQIVGRQAGFIREETTYEHCPFGMMLGSDGKPFKTRTGGTIKLAELLEEAVERAEKLMSERESDLSESEMKEIARKVGIGAVKFADLSKNRTSDYTFNWDHMLSFDGATAPYLQYAYTRVQSIFRKAGVDAATLTDNIKLEAEQEKALALKLLQFEEVVDQVIADAYPHFLCAYLFELASQYMSFYEACPVLKEGVEPALKNSRLMLCDLVGRTLKLGLDLLGIEVTQQM